jgi:hypothetical protein
MRMSVPPQITDGVDQVVRREFRSTVRSKVTHTKLPGGYVTSDGDEMTYPAVEMRLN